MINFPAREAIEKLMPIKFLPYTKGVSTTLLMERKKSEENLK